MYTLKDMVQFSRSSSSSKNINVVPENIYLTLSCAMFFKGFTEYKSENILKTIDTKKFYILVLFGSEKNNTRPDVYKRFFKICRKYNIRFSGSCGFNGIPKIYTLFLLDLNLLEFNVYASNLEEKQYKTLENSSILKVIITINRSFNVFLCSLGSKQNIFLKITLTKEVQYNILRMSRDLYNTVIEFVVEELNQTIRKVLGLLSHNCVYYTRRSTNQYGRYESSGKLTQKDLLSKKLFS